MLKSLSRAAQLAVRLSGRSAAVPGIISSSISPFSRSVWSRCHNGAASGYRPKLITSNRLLPSASCGCGALHTDGDKAFTEFLTDEIKEEKKIQKSETLPKLSGGWELELNGTEAKLVRSISGDKVTVTFNMNNSIPPQLEEEPEQTPKGPEHEPDIISTINFVVEVTKRGASNSLVFDCHLPEDQAADGDGEEERGVFAIREVSFQPEGDADWKETSYTLNTDSLDWALYDHLIDFLSDRGVDRTFADELIELSSSLEHQEYITFLEDLSGFITCK